MRAEDIMTPFVEKVTAATDLASAGRRFVKLGVHHLPLVDHEGRLAGMVFVGLLCLIGVFFIGRDIVMQAFG